MFGDVFHTKVRNPSVVVSEAVSQPLRKMKHLSLRVDAAFDKPHRLGLATGHS